MIHNSVVVLSLLGIAVGLPFGYEEEYEPEYEHIDDPSAFFDLDYNRIKNDVAASEPFGIEYRRRRQVSDYQGRYLSENDEYKSSVEDDGQYDPILYEEKYIRQYDDGQYRPHLYEQRHDGHYRSPQYSEGSSARNAPLHQRQRRSTERYQGPPAPLKQDFTVDDTPDIKRMNAAHFSAVANQFKKLQETAALAAAHPDRTSPPSKDYNPQHEIFVPQPQHYGQYLGRKKRSYAGQYSPQQPHYDDGQYRHHQHKYDDGQYRPHQHYHNHGQYRPHQQQAVDYNTEPLRPAPLNPDGTVAHLPEYHSIAASHLAAHQHAISTIRH